MKRYGQVFLLAIGFDLYWTLVVLFREQGLVIWTRTTTLPGWLLTALATLGGPLAYLFGERLGAITFLDPTFIVVIWMIPGWLVLMLFFHLLMGRQQ